MRLAARAWLAAAAVLAWTGAGPAASPSPAPAATMSAAPTPPLVPLHLAVTAATLTGVPRRTISATDEHGHTDTYGGVSLADVLAHAGAPSGAAVRGKAMTAYVVIGATDGYHALFSLAELDPGFTDHVVLLADSEDGAPQSAAVGPFRLIVPFDHRDARWVRNVTSIDLQIAPTP